MNRIKKTILVLIVILMTLCFIDAADQKPVADEMIGSSGINLLPKINYDQLILTVSRPDGSILRKTFEAGSVPGLDISTIAGSNFCEGSYSYELRVISLNSKKIREENPEQEKSKNGSEARQPEPSLTQTGYFTVRGGMIVTPSTSIEGQNRNTSRAEATYNESLYVTGSLCVGSGCSDPETFGTDVIRLKGNDLRINFDDTHATSSYPANDWRILINDTADGGGNYFAIEDTTAGVVPFKVEAGAPANSLYVEDFGRIGIKTSAPSVELHIVDPDSPAVRLEQEAGSFSAQAWDIAGNETNFFIRDVTNSSKLPFRIQPNTPSSTLCLKSDGTVGIGTWSPTYPLEVNTTGKNSVVLTKRTDGATNFMSATAGYAQFGAVSNHPVRILVNSIWKMMLNTNGSITMANGATLTVGGVWTNASSRKLKENIQSLTIGEALNTLNNLSPVKYNYKVDKTDKHVGFIAEDAPELVTTKDKNGMSPMDVVAVLTKVVQEQQKTIAELQKKIEKLEQK